MVGVGRDLCGSPSPTLLPKQGHLQQAYLLSTFHLDSDWSYLILRKKITITAETGSCELIFSLSCIDYYVKDSKSIYLNVSLEKKISVSAVECCQTGEKNTPDRLTPKCVDVYGANKRTLPWYQQQK